MPTIAAAVPTRTIIGERAELEIKKADKTTKKSSTTTTERLGGPTTTARTNTTSDGLSGSKRVPFVGVGAAVVGACILAF